LADFLSSFFAIPRAAIELEARAAVTLGHALHPQEGLGPHRLRAGVPAPQPPGDRGEEEQRQRRDDQQPGQEDEILRPEHQVEDEELARRQVEQHGLPAVPVDPREHVEHPEQHPCGQGPQPREPAVDLARIDLFVGDVQRLAAAMQRDPPSFIARLATAASTAPRIPGR
jgi:hypothetical protein